MAIAKVVYKENASATPEVWMDTTQKTVTVGTMLSGTTALKNDGTGITGNIASKSSSDLTASGATVTAPAGYYPSAASKSVASGSASTPATSITANPTISVNASGLITASISGSKSVTPTVSAGYVSSGTAGTVSVTGSNTEQLSTQSGTTITPTESVQTAVTSGKFTTGAVKVGAISSTYVGSGITQRDSTNLTASGATVTAPAGYYAEAASKSVASGSAGTPSATKGTVSNHSISVTPSVTNTTGYITGSTINGTAVTVNVSELESGTKSITENGTGISVSGYSAVDVDVPGQTPTGVKYVYTDVDGVGAWDVSGYAKCSVNGAPVNDGETRLTVKVDANDTISISAGGDVGIDWGDGTTTLPPGGSTYVTSSHMYSNAGYYRIVLELTGVASRLGNGAFVGTDSKQKALSVEINYDLLGQNYRVINNNCFAETTIIIAFMIVGKIQGSAFKNCKNLETVIIEKSANTTIESIGNNAFNGCSAIKKLIINSETPPTLGTDVFTGATESLAIYVPYSADHSILAAYQSATNWSTWASYIQEEPL